MNSIPEVSAPDGAAAVAAGACLLDVREADEWAAGHAPGAVWIPLGDLPARFGELDRSRPVVAVCRVGGRSARAAHFLIAQGLDVVNLTGGMLAWAEAGLPITDTDGAEGTVI